MPKSPRKELLHFGIGLIVIATLLLLGAIAIGVLYFLHAGTVSTFVDAKPLLVLLFFLFITLAILFIWIANLALRNRKYLPDGSPNPVVGGHALCAECQGMFNIQNMIEHQGIHICARCKPIFLQKLAEGATPAPGSAHEKSQPLL